MGGVQGLHGGSVGIGRQWLVQGGYLFAGHAFIWCIYLRRIGNWEHTHIRHIFVHSTFLLEQSVFSIPIWILGIVCRSSQYIGISLEQLFSRSDIFYHVALATQDSLYLVRL